MRSGAYPSVALRAATSAAETGEAALPQLLRIKVSTAPIWSFPSFQPNAGIAGIAGAVGVPGVDAARITVTRRLMVRLCFAPACPQN